MLVSTVLGRIWFALPLTTISVGYESSEMPDSEMNKNRRYKKQKLVDLILWHHVRIQKTDTISILMYKDFKCVPLQAQKI